MNERTVLKTRYREPPRRARSRLEHFRDPLWYITFGMGTFFALMAFFMTWG